MDCIIEVAPPEKDSRSYVFTYEIERPVASARALALRVRNLRHGTSLRRDRRQFGFVATNFQIPHHEYWDTCYPLIHLTRQGGPLFGHEFDEATIRLKYAVDEATARFFEARASDLGIRLRVDAVGSVDARREPRDDGATLAFGGGKDSRLLLGLLRELGRDVVPYQSGFPIGIDIENLHVSEAVSFGLADHVMPAMMAAGSSFYFGSGIGEAHRTVPWHRHFDFGSPRALAELDRHMSTSGPRLLCRAPLAGLPYNLIQRIIAVRYPRLHAFQHSVVPNEATEKNLHVSLCLLYHDLDFTANCSVERFRDLLTRFITDQLADPQDFGFRDYRLPIRLEMRGIIHRLRDHSLIQPVAKDVPSSWDAPWIDYYHPYVDPEPDERIVDIIHEFADDVPDSEFHIPV